MLKVEAEQFFREQIKTRWPRWRCSGAEVSDFLRQIVKLETPIALEAVIRTKENATTYTWPQLAEFRKYIREVSREKSDPTEDTSTPIEEKYISCYALNTDTGRNIEFMSKSSSPEGAMADFALYLKRFDKEPTDYQFYIGHENFDKFFHDRHAVFCRQNPRILEHTKKLQSKGQTCQGIVDEIPF
jgi:hypothetical protein